MTRQASDLYASSVRARIAAAAAYTVFATGGEPPAEWRTSWESTLAGRDPRAGKRWPAELARRCAPGVWPAHAFGTANAPILVLWHRPGMARAGSTSAPWIDPATPVLGGVGHAHVERYVPDALPQDRSWGLLHRWLGEGLSAFELAHPWAAVMVACLNDEPAVVGTVDQRRNREMLAPGGRIDHICAVVQPLLILACGGPVHAAITKTGWSAPPGAHVVLVNHPSAWEGYGSGRRHGRDLVAPLHKEWARTGRIPVVSADATLGKEPAASG